MQLETRHGASPVQSGSPPVAVAAGKGAYGKDTELPLLAVTLGATLLIYLRTAAFAFVFDDAIQIVSNPVVHSWRNAGTVFASTLLKTPYYRPLFLLWLRCSDALFGLNPTGWHVLSVVLHVAVTALVYFVVRRLSNARVALIAAALFGLHPIHIESVAWVSGVCDPLYSAFLLAAFLAYLHAGSEMAKEGSHRWLVLSCVLYTGALLSKEPAIVFPALVAVHAYVFAQGRRGKRLIEALRQCVPYVAVSIAYLVVRLAVVASGPVPGASLSVRSLIFTEPSVLWFYVTKLFWPVGLSVFYDTPYVSSPSLAHFVLPLFGLLLGAGGIGWWARRSEKGKLITFAAVWFLITLAPALDLRLLVPGEIAHDRYLYLPSLGFCVLAAIALDRWSTKLVKSSTAAPNQLNLAGAVAVAICVSLAGLNVAQQGHWASDAALYAHGFVSAPNNNEAVNNYARLLTDSGELQRAVVLYQKVLERDPKFEPAQYNLGYTYYRLGEPARARQHLQRAVALRPDDAYAQVYLGLIDLREHDLAGAEAAILRGIALEPYRPGFHMALSYVLEAKGELRPALAAMQEELRYSPNANAVLARKQALAAAVAAGH